MEVAPSIEAAATERLTASGSEDLVDAHLAINHAYHGAIDKTLAGFVVLDDTGQDYTLLDLRDGQQIWRQDHETRGLTLELDSFDELLAVRRQLAAGAERVAHGGRQPPTPRSSRLVSSPALLARYQWLVWLLAQPLRTDGVARQSADDLVRAGIGRFRQIWRGRDHRDTAFEAELGELAHDPHLAIYWLLHATLLDDDERRARTIREIGSAGPELVQAFAARLGGLPLAGELPIVPEFRSRRALATMYGGFELQPHEVSAAALRALEIEPGTNALRNGLQVLAGLDGGELDAEAIGGSLARITSSSTGTELVLAALDKRTGITSSAHADTLARRLDGTQPWWLALEALWHVHELAYDGAALVAATREILAHDRYHRRALQMAMRAAQIAGEPIDHLEADLELADAILEPYQQLLDHPDQLRELLEPLAGPARSALAQRVLQRAALNRPDPAVMAWASGLIVSSADPARGLLVTAALAALDARTRADVIARAQETIDAPDHPLAEVLLAFLDGPEPPASDLTAEAATRQTKEAALGALAPWFHEPALFDRMVALLERPAGASTIVLLCTKLLEASDAVARLDPSHAVHLARALIGVRLRHPAGDAREAAGDQLSRFHHPGTESFLIDALSEYGTRYAEGSSPGGAELAHGRTETDELPALVANLHAAVAGFGTERARAATAGGVPLHRGSEVLVARTAGVPTLHVTDAQLAQLAGAPVAHRLLHDAETGEVWFRDPAAKLHYFDGYTVAAPRFVSRAGELEGVRELLASAVAIDERVLEWDTDARGFRELLRIGRSVLISWGIAGGPLEHHVVTFTELAAASVAFAQLRAHPPAGFVADDPYGVRGDRTIERTYHVPLAGGGEEHRQVISIDPGADRSTQIAEHERRGSRGCATTTRRCWGSRGPRARTARPWSRRSPRRRRPCSLWPCQCAPRRSAPRKRRPRRSRKRSPPRRRRRRRSPKRTPRRRSPRRRSPRRRSGARRGP